MHQTHTLVLNSSSQCYFCHAQRCLLHAYYNCCFLHQITLLLLAAPHLMWVRVGLVMTRCSAVHPADLATPWDHGTGCTLLRSTHIIHLYTSNNAPVIIEKRLLPQLVNHHVSIIQKSNNITNMHLPVKDRFLIFNFFCWYCFRAPFGFNWWYW